MTSRVLLSFLLLAAVALGCAPRPRQAPPAPPTARQNPPSTRPNVLVAGGKPIIDFGRGAGALPLNQSTLSATPDDLIAALVQAYSLRVVLPSDAAPVELVGDYPTLDLLRVDLSGATIRPQFRPSQLRRSAQPQPGITARRFEYFADPIKYQSGETHLRIEADDVTFGVIADERGTASLLMTDARSGTLHFAAPMRDLRSMLRSGGRTNSGGVFSIHDVRADLATPDPRTLHARVHVYARWLLIPTNFRLEATANIDENANVRLSNLACRAENASGLLIAPLIDSAMKKQEGRLLPLAHWPGNKIRVHDVRFEVTDRLQIHATFGHAPA